MADLIWGETHERRQHIDNFPTALGLFPADTRISIFASKDKVAMVDATLFIRKHKSGKAHYEWRSCASMGFFRNSAGNLQPYVSRRNITGNKKQPWTSHYTDSVFQTLAIDGQEAIQQFQAACKKYLNVSSVEDIYPLAEMMGVEKFSALPSNIRPYMRTRDWNEFVARAFGKTRATHEMVKAVSDSEPIITSIAYEFRGLVEDERLVKFLNDNSLAPDSLDGFTPFTPRIRTIIKALDNEELEGLLSSDINMESLGSIRVNSEAMNSFALRANRHGKRLAPTKKSASAITDWKSLTTSAFSW